MSKAKQFIQPIRTVVGEADIDVSEEDYTTLQELMTLLNSGTEPIEDVVIRFDLDKTTTGFVAKFTASQTILIAAAYKIDGVNYRAMVGGTDAILLTAEELLTGAGVEIKIGTIMPAEDCQIQVMLSTEVAGDDVEIPYRVNYRGVAPTITAVAIP